MIIMSPSSVETTVLQDGQATGSITPAFLRIMNNSIAGVASTTQAASYSPMLTDRGIVVEMNAGTAVNFTIQPVGTVAFAVGTVLAVCQMGAGQVTVVAGTGVTLRTASSLTTRAQYSTITVRQRAANDWIVSGDLT